MTGFVDAVAKATGRKQTIPADWLEDGHPFADQFTLPPSARDDDSKSKPAAKPKTA